MIILCDNTRSGYLRGAVPDGRNLYNHLISPLGGEWAGGEILTLRNPKASQLVIAVTTFLRHADYSFISFSGHGFMDGGASQFIELEDRAIPLESLVGDVPRQTFLIDACRNYYTPVRPDQGIYGVPEQFTGDIFTTRGLFDEAVLTAGEGISVMFSASKNQTALDSDAGGAYTYSVLRGCKIWERHASTSTVFSIDDAHRIGTTYMREHFSATQEPEILHTNVYGRFPLAVRFGNGW